MSNYQIFEQNGKFGLADEGAVLLKPVYTSLEITNNDPPEYAVSYYSYEPRITKVYEWNFPIVIADGKQGLASWQGRMQLDVTYDWIIKLTYSHYLCQEKRLWTLYDLLPGSTTSTPFTITGEVTLDNLLQSLVSAAPGAHEALMKKLQKTNYPGRYISKYRYYLGEQDLGVGMYQGFVVATTRSIITNDFQVTPALARAGEWI